MPRTRNANSLLNRLLEYRHKNLLKRLSEGWSISAASAPDGHLMNVSLVDEAGHFQSQLKSEDLDLFIELELIEGQEAPRKTRFDITNYTLRRVA
jgi:hypothetical protein